MIKRSTLVQQMGHLWALFRAARPAAHDDTNSALLSLDRVFVGRSGAWPEELPVLAAVLYAYLYERRGEPAKAVQALRHALVTLDRGIDIDWGAIRKADREYLYFYCKWLCARVAHVDDFAAASALSIGGSFTMLDLDKTAEFLKRWFPIPADAAAEVDALIERRMPKTGFSRS